VTALATTPDPVVDAVLDAFLTVMRARHPELVWKRTDLPVAAPDQPDPVLDRRPLAA
jgi:hypothetical protein